MEYVNSLQYQRRGIIVNSVGFPTPGNVMDRKVFNIQQEHVLEL
jgi:hypothetical protein